MTSLIRTLLVDDEYLALNLLAGFLQQVPDLEVVAKVKRPLEALTLLAQQPPIDLLFLDVQMPQLSGTQLLRTLTQRPVTIFTTAYSEYAVEAFGLDAVDYLPKPYSLERLLQAVGKARQALRLRHLPPVAPPAFLTVKADGRYTRLPLADILFVEGWQEYVRIHTRRQGVVVTLERLKNLEQQLPAAHFLRVHKSYLVAISQVEALEGNELKIGAHRIPISRDARELVLAQVFGVGR